MLRSDFLTSLGATTVAATSPFPPITPTVSIGVVAPLSGPARALGQSLTKGVQGAIQYTNELAGSLQRTFVMRAFDDQNNAANASLSSGFTTGDSTIFGVVGHIKADATLQGIANYGPAQMPLVVPVTTDDRITATQFRSVFRLPTKDTFEGEIFARTVADQFKPKTPYVFVQDAEYGADVANGFISQMQSLKITAPYQQFSYNKPDFGAVADKAMTTQPDYVFLAGVVGDMGPIVGVLRAKGYTGPIGASQGFWDPATIKLGAPAEGMMISTSMPYLPLAPGTLRWVQEYNSHFGQLDPIAAFGYAAAQILITAIQRTNAVSRVAVITAIQQSIPIETMVGSYTFGTFGDAMQPQLYYYTVKDGKMPYLKQAHPSTFMVK